MSDIKPDIWGPIAESGWRGVPHLSGRLAVEADVKEGRAVFFQHGEGVVMEPVEMELPQAAILRAEGSSPERVIVIQVERSAHQVLVGYRPLCGGNGIATLAEVEFLEKPDLALWSSEAQ